MNVKLSQNNEKEAKMLREKATWKITDVVFMKIKMRSVEAQKDNVAELSYEEERASFFIVTNIRNQN